jgi:hypothetical protein
MIRYLIFNIKNFKKLDNLLLTESENEYIYNTARSNAIMMVILLDSI